jgi:hypothetical protein
MSKLILKPYNFILHEDDEELDISGLNEQDDDDDDDDGN